MKARSLIDAQQAADPAGDAANHAADRSTYGTTFGGAAPPHRREYLEPVPLAARRAEP
ncbi:MAG: hypothetical protein ACREDU_06715 [Methylocella sp.]